MSARDTLEVAIPDEIGALVVWRIELRAGTRRPTDFDPLWRAACYEQRARDELRAGLYAAAAEDRERAALIILDAKARRER